MSKIFKNPLFYIFLLALVLRIYKLGAFPYGFHVDEVKVGWNAFSILKTGLDDHGNKLSLYYNSIGDYRPTGIFYATIPSIILFGKTIFATRLPSALFGSLTVLPLFFLVKELTAEVFNKKTKIKNKLPLFAALLLAINPWHIETSRATSEVVISTFFVISALYFFIKLIKENNKKYLIFTLISILLSYLFYHSIRVLCPPFLLVTAFFYFTEIKKLKSKKFVVFILVFTVLLTLFFGHTKEGLKRFHQVSIFEDEDVKYQIERIQNENITRTLATIIFDNKEVIYARRFLTEYSKYFGGDFLIGEVARPYRYTTPGIGLITYVESVLLIIGVLQIAKRRKSFLPLILLLLAPLPAALTIEDSPNLHRSFLMLPMIIIIESYGLEKILELSKKYKTQVVLTTFSLLVINFSLFVHMYLNHSMSHRPYLKNFVVDGSTRRNIGARELSLKIDEIKTNYEKIVVSSKLDNNYPWFAFFTNKDPKEFNNIVMNSKDGNITYQNILFSNIPCPSDDSFKNFQENKLLVVDFGDCATESKIKDGLPVKIVDQILRPDDTVAYRLIERK